MPPVRPVIGITCSVEAVSWGVWKLDAALVPVSYVRAIEHAGGCAILVPPSDAGVQETLGVLDGLLLSGGSDLDPALYGADPHPETADVRPERDRTELALLEGALARDMPVLGVCRGSQVLNVGLGGDLVQHLPDVLASERHKHEPGAFGDHDVELEGESRLGAILGDRAPVKSHHHQGFGGLGAGLRDVAWADDGTVEGLEDPARRFAVGVLWHPEEGEDFALFEAFVEEARAYRAERAVAAGAHAPAPASAVSRTS